MYGSSSADPGFGMVFLHSAIIACLKVLETLKQCSGGSRLAKPDCLRRGDDGVKNIGFLVKFAAQVDMNHINVTGSI